MDLWNYFDMGGIVLFIIHLLLALSGATNHSKNDSNILLTLAIFLMCGRGIGDLRAFKGTRYLVRLIIEVFLDLPSFMVMFFMIFYIFAVIFYVISEEKEGRDDAHWIFEELAGIFLLAYGDFSTDDYDNV